MSFVQLGKAVTRGELQLIKVVFEEVWYQASPLRYYDTKRVEWEKALSLASGNPQAESICKKVLSEIRNNG